MTWLQTRSGLAFDFEAPKPDQIDICDIAHALGHTCRFVGHCSRFYSVAEHSVHASDLLLPAGLELARWGLMHDAHEAYVGDVPSPLKTLLADYRALEDVAAQAVRSRFGLEGEMPAAVKGTDIMLLKSEAEALHRAPPRDWHLPETFPALTGIPSAGWDPPCWDPHEAATNFLDRYWALFVEQPDHEVRS